MLWELPEAYCLFDPVQNSDKSDRACKWFSSLPCIDFSLLGEKQKTPWSCEKWFSAFSYILPVAGQEYEGKCMFCHLNAISKVVTVKLEYSSQVSKRPGTSNYVFFLQENASFGGVTKWLHYQLCKGTANAGEVFSGKRDNGSVSQLRKWLLENVFSPRVSQWDQIYDQSGWSHCLYLSLDCWAWQQEYIFQCIWLKLYFQLLHRVHRILLKIIL